MFYTTGEGYLALPVPHHAGYMGYRTIEDLVAAIGNKKFKREPIQVRGLRIVSSDESSDEVSLIGRLTYTTDESPAVFPSSINVVLSRSIPTSLRLSFLRGTPVDGYLIGNSEAVLLKRD